MNIAIIPAKINSRRIKKKNIKIFVEKPIIQYSVEAAKKSKIFDKIYVSTDSTKISNFSKKLGVEVIKRPLKLSANKVGILDVIKYSIIYLNTKKIKPSNVCCIFSTCPMIEYKKICQGYRLFKRLKPNYLISASSFNSNIFSSFKLNAKKKIIKTFPKIFNSNNGDKINIYYDAGQFYWGKTETWLKKIPMFTSKSSIIKIDRSKSQDINTMEDWKFAKFLFQSNKILGL